MTNTPDEIARIEEARRAWEADTSSADASTARGGGRTRWRTCPARIT